MEDYDAAGFHATQQGAAGILRPYTEKFFRAAVFAPGMRVLDA